MQYPETSDFIHMPKSFTRQSSSFDITQIKIINVLAEGKFPVFLGTTSNNKTSKYAVKLFPFKKGAQSANYINEKKFQNIHQPNIASPIQCLDERCCENPDGS